MFAFFPDLQVSFSRPACTWKKWQAASSPVGLTHGTSPYSSSRPPQGRWGCSYDWAFWQKGLFIRMGICLFCTQCKNATVAGKQQEFYLCELKCAKVHKLTWDGPAVQDSPGTPVTVFKKPLWMCIQAQEFFSVSTSHPGVPRASLFPRLWQQIGPLCLFNCYRIYVNWGRWEWRQCSQSCDVLQRTFFFVPFFPHRSKNVATQLRSSQGPGNGASSDLGS